MVSSHFPQLSRVPPGRHSVHQLGSLSIESSTHSRSCLQGRGRGSPRARARRARQGAQTRGAPRPRLRSQGAPLSSGFTLSYSPWGSFGFAKRNKRESPVSNESPSRGSVRCSKTTRTRDPVLVSRAGPVLSKARLASRRPQPCFPDLSLFLKNDDASTPSDFFRPAARASDAFSPWYSGANGSTPSVREPRTGCGDCKRHDPCENHNRSISLFRSRQGVRLLDSSL